MLVLIRTSVPVATARIGSESVSSIHEVSAVVVLPPLKAMLPPNSDLPAWFVTE